MWVIVAFVAGFIVGCIFVTIVLRRKSVGSLLMANDPDDGPYLFLQLSKALTEKAELPLATKSFWAHGKKMRKCLPSAKPYRE